MLSIQQKRLLLHHRLHHSLAAAASTALTLSHSLTHSPACSLVWLYRCSHTLRFSFVGSCCHSIYVLSHSHVDMYQHQPRVTLVAVVLLALACLLAGEAQVSIPSHTPPNTLHGAVLGHRHELVHSLVRVHRLRLYSLPRFARRSCRSLTPRPRSTLTSSTRSQGP